MYTLCTVKTQVTIFILYLLFILHEPSQQIPLYKTGYNLHVSSSVAIILLSAGFSLEGEAQPPVPGYWRVGTCLLSNLTYRNSLQVLFFPIYFPECPPTPKRNETPASEGLNPEQRRKRKQENTNFLQEDFKATHSLQLVESFCLQVLYHQLFWCNPAYHHGFQIPQIYQNTKTWTSVCKFTFIRT